MISGEKHVTDAWFYFEWNEQPASYVKNDLLLILFEKKSTFDFIEVTNSVSCFHFVSDSVACISYQFCVLIYE